MPLDEFGREIPGLSSSSRFSYNDYDDQQQQEPQEARDYDHSSNRSSHVSSYADLAKRRSRSPSPSLRSKSRSRSPDRGRSSSYRRHADKRRHSSSSDDHHYDDSNKRGGGSHNQTNRGRKYSRSKGRRKLHSSLMYMEEPIMCQYLFAKETQKEADQLFYKQLDKDKKGDNHDDTGNVPQEPQEQEANISMDPSTGLPTDNSTMQSTQQQTQQTQQQPPIIPEEELKQLHQEYNQQTCLKYIHNFFNKHLDDSWFRTRYSPLQYKLKIQKSRQRAKNEALAILQETIQSPQEFVKHSRLGGGFKNKPSGQTEYVHKKRKYSSSIDNAPHLDLFESLNLPKSHLFSFLHNHTALPLMDIPSHVTDEQLLSAIKVHSSNGDNTLFPIDIVSTEVVTGVCDAVTKALKDGDEDDEEMNHENDRNDNPSNSKLVIPKYAQNYQRNAWAIFNTEQAKEKVLDNIIAAYMDSDCGRHVRDSRSVPKDIEMHVDCSDPYMRYDIDADGKGGKPANADAVMEGENQVTPEGEASAIPIRRVPIFVSTTSPLKSQSTMVLSAAVSSNSRIDGDTTSAVDIAKRMDGIKDIPHEARLETILGKLFPKSEENENNNEDVLDVAIAYLRRVHLFSFYNGGISSDNGVGHALTSGHPLSVIHQRLKDADQILQKAKEENADMYDDVTGTGGDDNVKKEEEGTDSSPTSTEPKDMLVILHDETIQNVIKSIPSNSGPSPFVINESIDALASEIQSAEEKTKKEWIENHSIDDNGRARCSFHFCQKLFKDDVFLTKHLLKKHGEYLKAEQAKCHDEYMMKWWDDEVCRPVPKILVDCNKYGTIPKPIIGSSTPMIEDPEPGLWQEEQDRNAREKEEEKMYLEQRAAMEASQGGMKRGRGDSNADGGNFGNSNFVDVDDMKEEKVELSFTEVENVKPVKKKKKKKRKLL